MLQRYMHQFKFMRCRSDDRPGMNSFIEKKRKKVYDARSTIN